MGRIVFFRRADGSFFLHRIRRIRKDGSLLICGDAQSWTEVIAPDQVLAVVIAVQRETGRLISVRSLGWRLTSALWYPTRPFRYWLLPVYQNQGNNWQKAVIVEKFLYFRLKICYIEGSFQ